MRATKHDQPRYQCSRRPTNKRLKRTPGHLKALRNKNCDEIYDLESHAQADAGFATSLPSCLCDVLTDYYFGIWIWP
ncbi:hypothetical protein JYU34_003566 [Plutella xylostella]|uniref:Uncharacterized protein n=1 Tax=Plutella xylostella TaxID=51655 RepID=A0ABQ7R0D0_PLUXY|nr:hypothetical protein JYU34_003566 [Plutella xylostella]